MLFMFTKIFFVQSSFNHHQATHLQKISWMKNPNKRQRYRYRKKKMIIAILMLFHSQFTCEFAFSEITNFVRISVVMVSRSFDPHSHGHSKLKNAFYYCGYPDCRFNLNAFIQNWNWYRCPFSISRYSWTLNTGRHANINPSNIMEFC